MNKITSLTLYFPHGTSVFECQRIAQYAEKIVQAGVSEGGMTPTSKYGMYVDNIIFSEDSMSYIYGHDRKTSEGARNETP